MGFDVAALVGGAADIFGGGAAVAAEAAPEALGAADVLGAGAGDALAATAAADIPGYGLAAADQAALYGVADAGAAADLTGAGFAGGALGGADLAAAGGGVADLGGLLPAAADLGLAPGASSLPANAAALGEAAGNTGALSAIPPTVGGGAQAAGGIVPASSALPLPGSAFDVTQMSGAGLGGFTSTSPQFAEAGASDVGLGAPAQADIPGMLGQPVTQADFSGVGDIPGLTGTNAAPPDVTPQASATTYTAPSAGGGATSAAGGGGGGAGGGGGGTGGGFDYWKAAGLGLAAAPLAITLARGQQMMPQQGLQSGALANQVGADSTQLLNQAMQGQVMPGQQAALTLSRQNMINQARQQLYDSGIQNPEASSMWPQMMANIDQQIAVQQQQFLTANINEAFTGTGQAQQNLTNLAQQQVNLDNAYTNAIAGATGSLGRLIGQSGGRIL